MKQRITFISRAIGQENADTTGLEFSSESVSVPSSLYEQRQDRLTLEWHEIEPVFQGLLDNVSKLKLSFKSPEVQTTSVFQNYHSSGFTIQLLPKSPLGLNQSIDSISEYFAGKLDLPLFNHENYVTTAASLTYHIPPSSTHISQHSLFNIIKSLNIDPSEFSKTIQDFEIIYDSSNRALKLQFISKPTPNSAEVINKSSSVRKEIALLSTQNEDLEDLELSGLRTTLPSANNPEDYLPPTKTLMYIKPRHHHLISNSSIALSTPIGLHPTFKFTDIPSQPFPEYCELFISTILPAHLFFDKYQYNSKQLSLLGHWGESDLEAPIWKVSQFGSIQFLKVNEGIDDLELQYHSRYLEPSANQQVSISTPDLFYACDSSKIFEDYNHIKLNPFDDSLLGIDSFFDPNTVFYHIGREATNTLDFKIPNLSWDDYLKSQVFTLLIVLLGTGYFLFKIFKSSEKKQHTKTQ